MNYDICFCANKECKQRKFCARNTDRLKNWPWPVAMALFMPDEELKCNDFIPSPDTITDTKTLEELHDNPR